MTRAGRLGVVVALLGVVAAGCRTDVGVAVAVRPDGSGAVTVTVTLDADAAKQLGDPANVALGDLRTSGWSVPDPVGLDGGGLRFVALRRFASPAQLQAVLAEVGGAGGVFRGTRLQVIDGFASTSYRFRTRIDLTGDPTQFGDAELTAALGGLPLGRTAEELVASGATRADAARLTVTVELPGAAPDTNGAVREGRSEWTYPLTGGRSVATVLRAASSDIDSATLSVFAAGAALVLAALVVLVVGLVRTRRAT